MPSGRRKTPFSGKAKKEQLKQKRAQKGGAKGRTQEDVKLTQEYSSDDGNEKSLEVQKFSSTGDRRNRYALQFAKESEEELLRRKKQAYHPVKAVSEEELEVDGARYHASSVTIPMRQAWDYDMDKETLEAQEEQYFKKYIEEQKVLGVSSFDLNLETWRQLWRVLERADILVFVTDIRFSALQFSPALYRHVTDDLKKKMLLVLNKVDLVEPGLAVAWKSYFEINFPGLHVTYFSSLCGLQKPGVKSYKRQKLGSSPECALAIVEACEKLLPKADLNSWKSSILHKEDEELVVDESASNEVTLGLVGTPNAGKSSVLNSLKGHKVVSVSKTPGHTKHFQTIYLTSNVILCDCPGLVFPSTVPKELQILSGNYPVAQVREPFSVVKFIAERISLPAVLKLKHPEGENVWTAMDICDAWATVKKFKTTKGRRNDWNRAANYILRMTVDGAVCLSLRPPGYTKEKGKWAQVEGVQSLKNIMANPSRVLREKAEGGASEGSKETEEDTSEEQSSTDDEEELQPTNRFEQFQETLENEEKEDKGQLSEESEDEDADLGAKEWERLQENRFKDGFREGISDGEDSCIQYGFDAGYRTAYTSMFTLAQCHGALSGLLLDAEGSNTSDTDDRASQVKALQAEIASLKQELSAALSNTSQTFEEDAMKRLTSGDSSTQESAGLRSRELQHLVEKIEQVVKKVEEIAQVEIKKCTKAE